MIQRQDKCEKSVQDYLEAQLFGVQGYPQNLVEVLEAFDGSRFESGLDKNYVAIGFNFDDGGKEAECGSTLVRKLITIEMFIVAVNATWGRNLKNAIQSAFEEDRAVPLKDVGEPGEAVIDFLPVISCSGEHQPIPKPAPWQKFIWTIHLRLEDEYMVVV